MGGMGTVGMYPVHAGHAGQLVANPALALELDCIIRVGNYSASLGRRRSSNYRRFVGPGPV